MSAALARAPIWVSLESGREGAGLVVGTGLKIVGDASYGVSETRITSLPHLRLDHGGPLRPLPAAPARLSRRSAALQTRPTRPASLCRHPHLLDRRPRPPATYLQYFPYASRALGPAGDVRRATRWTAGSAAHHGFWSERRRSGESAQTAAKMCLVSIVVWELGAALELRWVGWRGCGGRVGVSVVAEDRA